MTCICRKQDIDIDDLTTQWNETYSAVKENLTTVNAAVLEPSSNSVIASAIDQLEINNEKMEGIYKTVNNALALYDDAHIGKYPKKKVTAIACSSFKGVAFLVGVCALSLDQLDKVLPLSTNVKWTGFGFCLAGIILAQVNDWLWNDWGNEERNQRRLLDLKAKGSMISCTEQTIRILRRFLKVIEEKDQDTSKNWQQTLRRIDRLTHRSQKRESQFFVFKPLIETLRSTATARGFRRSQIFTVFSESVITPPTPRLEANEEEDNQSSTCDVIINTGDPEEITVCMSETT